MQVLIVKFKKKKKLILKSAPPNTTLLRPVLLIGRGPRTTYTNNVTCNQ